MKKRVIQINGLGGILMVLFVLSCLIAGFVVFPAFVSMSAWNYFAGKMNSVATIPFAGGFLLWGIIALTFMIFNKRKLIVSFKMPTCEDELQTVLKKIEDEEMGISEIQSEIERRQSDENKNDQ